MDAMLYVVPVLIMAAAGSLAYRVVYRWLQIRSAWNSGLTAEARCLKAYATVHGGRNDTSVRTTLHHVYEFTARDGSRIRFEEEGGPGTTVEGDIVTVHYAEGCEGVVATARPPRRGRQAVVTAGVLGFVFGIVLFCVGFMTTVAVDLHN
ncbi:hypothetical protein ACFYZJ_15065 [Streptomyces sp. NPDC001848]|uniref:hypothetical protein n=1 Tax=Streptomyces sp. NPDC001848 TaxID=3364618 RepID=UPI0036B1E339